MTAKPSISPKIHRKPAKPIDVDAIKERVYCPSARQAVQIGEYEACARAIVEHDAPALLAEAARLREHIAAMEGIAGAANWPGMWAEIFGYVKEAVDDGQGIENAHDLLGYMNECKRRHVTEPVRAALDAWRGGEET